MLSEPDQKTRQVAFNTIVRLGLEYGCLFWDPYMEKHTRHTILERGLQFVFNIKVGVSFTELKAERAINSWKIEGKV